MGAGDPAEGESTSHEHNWAARPYSSFCPNHKSLNCVSLEVWSYCLRIKKQTRLLCLPLSGHVAFSRPYTTHSPTEDSDNWQEEKKGGGKGSSQQLVKAGAQKTLPLLVPGIVPLLSPGQVRVAGGGKRFKFTVREW